MSENETTVTARNSLLDAARSFVESAAGLPGVQRIALIGSLLTDRPYPKDVDLLVCVSGGTDLAPLAAAARRLKGRLQSQNRGADIFLADEQARYLGRICSWRVCAPGVRLACDALHCGRRPYLHDDLATIRLDSSLVAAPPLQLWPTVVRRAEIPGDVEVLARRLEQPHNKPLHLTPALLPPVARSVAGERQR
jgi:hypothetical protein